MVQGFCPIKIKITQFRNGFRLKLLVFREMSENLFFSVVLFQLNSNLVSTMSNIMEADSALLVKAQQRSKACSRFVP